MPYTKNERGSEWRKWDLHIHTPKSIIQNYKDTHEAWDKFILALENLPKEVQVIGITDYYFIDGYEEVMKYRSKGRLKNIHKIFPILEFRTDTFGSGSENKLQKLNLHILFNLDEEKLEEEIRKVREHFIDVIKLSPSENHTTTKLSLENFAKEGGNLKDGFESFVPSTKSVFEVVNSKTWKNDTFLMIGYKEYSNLDKNNQLKPIKKELYDKVDAFLGSNFPNHEANQKWLNQFGTKRWLHSLDIHGFDLLDTYELDELGSPTPSKNYSCNTWIKADPTYEGLKQIIYEADERIILQEYMPEDKSSYQIIDRIEIDHITIANKYLKFNANLNSIIGGRSTGKSVLLAAIAKKLKTEKPVQFSHNLQYDQFVSDISSKIKIFWKDGKEENVREIEYFEQGYMYDLARDQDKLSRLIQNILRIKGKETVLDDYNNSVTDNKKKITTYINDLWQIKQLLLEKEQKSRDKGDRKGVEAEILRLTLESSVLNTNLVSETDRNAYEFLQSKIDQLSQQKLILSKSLGTLISILNLKPFKDNISFELTNFGELKRIQISNIYDNLVSNFEQDWKLRIYELIDLSLLEQIATDIELDEIISNPIHQAVLLALNKSNQLSELLEKIKFQRNVLNEIISVNEEIAELIQQRDDLIGEIEKASNKYYDLVEDVLPNLSESVDDLKILANNKFNSKEYREIISSALDQRSSENQEHIVYSIAPKSHMFDSELKTLFDKTLKGGLVFKGGYTAQAFISRIMGENFFKIAYNLDYEGDDFSMMSDGKKAFVVLKLLLDFSDKSCPILIDQPEDDLDNRAIYLDLVQYLRKKKKIRQIIVATHNPNIVVGADSELVIVANQHGVKNTNRSNCKFQYVSGSLEKAFENKSITEILESKGIRQHVCEILEGGDAAFKKRDEQYRISK